LLISNLQEGIQTQKIAEKLLTVVRLQLTTWSSHTC